jgi:tetratricopeptide (TPR) repeat protein
MDGKLDEAIEQYQKALSVQPSFASAMNNLARVYGMKGEYDRAASLYLEIVEARPESYVAYYNIACIYSEQNRAEESIDWLKKAVEKGFGDWDFLKKDTDLENIRGSSYYREFISGLEKE